MSITITPATEVATPEASDRPGPPGTRVPHRIGCRCLSTDEPATMIDERYLPGFLSYEALHQLGKLVRSQAIDPVFHYRRERYNDDGDRIGPELAIRSCEAVVIRAAVDAFASTIENMAQPAAVSPDRHDIDLAIRELLYEAGVTQAEAARQSGIPLTTLNRKLNGKGRAFLVTELAALRGVLGVAITTMALRAEQIATRRANTGVEGWHDDDAPRRRPDLV